MINQAGSLEMLWSTRTGYVLHKGVRGTVLQVDTVLPMRAAMI